MYNIALVKFIAENGEEAGRIYEYRIPEYMVNEVQVDMLGVVNWRGGNRINPSAVRIKEIKSVLDGDYVGDYAYMIGAFSTARYEDLIHAERRKKRLVELIKAEQRKLVDTLDFDRLASLSPTAAELISELRAMDAPDCATPKQTVS